MEKNYLVNGRIPTYKIEKEFDLLKSLPKNKPSTRIVSTKKGLKAIEALIDLQKNDNTSWYEYLKKRSQNNMNDLALFYRGNKITFREMFQKSDEICKSMINSGLKYGEEIGVCVTNSPELVYIILAANKIGLKVNLFGAGFNKDYLEIIVNDISPKAIFLSDDIYDEVSSVIENKKIDNIIVSSLADSLPENPTLCDEYEPKLAKYYYYENKIDKIKNKNNKIKSLTEYIEEGRNCEINLDNQGNLETDFLITYTSGSTKIGFPKAIIHKNRSLITMGRFHDPELCGNPKIPGLRGLAHIHPESNTDVITCISDNLLQGWSVALEPEYDSKKALDYIILNKPNYLNITTSFMLEIAKEYLIEKRYHENGKGRKLPFLLATFTVGEGTQKGEEKFINKFLREAKAGSGVSVKGLKMPFTTLSIGGGDCEHGGIYYTLWKSLYQNLYKPILGKEDIGLLPVPYVVVTALRKNDKGIYEECDYGEDGIIVANSYTNLSCYKNNIEETNKLILEDNLGRKWVSCNVLGHINSIGGVNIKGRIYEKENNNYGYMIDSILSQDTKNILSSTTVNSDNNLVINIQTQPLKNINLNKLNKSIIDRLSKILPEEIIESLYIRNINNKTGYPLTGSGKKNIKALENMKLNDTIKLSELINKEENIKKLVIKK